MKHDNNVQLELHFPCGSIKDSEYKYNNTIEDIKVDLNTKYSFPLNETSLRMTHTRTPCSDTSLTLLDVYKSGYYKSDKILLDVIVNIHGGQKAFINCGDFDLEIKCLCCFCGCTKEWKKFKLFCIDGACSIQ